MAQARGGSEDRLVYTTYPKLSYSETRSIRLLKFSQSLQELIYNHSIRGDPYFNIFIGILQKLSWHKHFIMEKNDIFIFF